MRFGTEWPAKHPMKSLRLLGSVGEPINPEAWMWYRETSATTAAHRGHLVADRNRDDHDHPAPGATPTTPGTATRPFPAWSPT